MNRLYKKVILVLLSVVGFTQLLSGQDKFVDVIIESFYSNANPNFSSFYGNNGTTDGCKLRAVDPSVCTGDSDSLVALPAGSYIIAGFTDNLVFDAPGQDDLFIEEIGGGQEFGDLWVSPNGIDFTYLDIINGAQINSFDLADYPYDDFVKAVRIEGIDQGGCIPGLDISRIYGLEGANCACGAELAELEDGLCVQKDTLIDLELLELDTTNGMWVGPQVIDNVFDPEGLEGELKLLYLINVGHPICPVDTIEYFVDLGNCDCLGILDGEAILDDCGECNVPGSSAFNQGCLDCMGIPNGSSLIDSCGVCLDSLDLDFNSSCLDCLGNINGEAVFDLCGNCLLPDAPEFNQDCEEKFKFYLSNIFNPSAGERFGIQHSPDNLGFVNFFRVFDRWGNLVYQVEGLELVQVESWWNGTFDNKDLEQGTYFYHFDLTFPIIGEVVNAGSVLLLK